MRGAKSSAAFGAPLEAKDATLAVKRARLTVSLLRAPRGGGWAQRSCAGGQGAAKLTTIVALLMPSCATWARRS